MTVLPMAIGALPIQLVVVVGGLGHDKLAVVLKERPTDEPGLVLEQALRPVLVAAERVVEGQQIQRRDVVALTGHQLEPERRAA